MCGICGIYNFDRNKPVTRDVLQSMCRTIYHRGPDDEGIFIKNNVGMGTRRLSIIDLEGGHQPLSNEKKSVWASHNGEIYNFPELREHLISKGYCFRTQTDTEILVHGYAEWGDDLAQKLRGMYASAIWDDDKKRLTIIRDRIGIKPLYYTLINDKTLVYGSELKALLKHPEIQLSIDPQALDLFLTLEYIPAPFSIFKNIFKLPPGNRLVCQNNHIDIKSYWNPENKVSFFENKNIKNLALLKEELFSLLKESVKLRLISDVPLGAFLSGGIDSSCIVGLMRELDVSPLKTFSIGFEDKSYDELAHARRIANKFDTEHHEFIIQPQALELTHKLIRHLDEPFGDFSIFPTYLVSKMAGEHVKVILSGDGGDEIFGGYEHYQAQKFSEFPLVPAMSKCLNPLLKRIPPSAQKKGLWNKLRRFTQGFENEKEMRHFRWMMFLSNKDKQSLYSKDLNTTLDDKKLFSSKEPFKSIIGSLNKFDSINGELFLDLKTYLADDILVKVDRMSMAVSLETRVPLLDHKLVEFAFSLPGNLKIKAFTSKWLFKKTMEGLLPEENIYRKKEGFSIPIKHWLRTDLKEILCDTLTEKRIREEGFFNYQSVQKMIDLHLTGKENFSHQLWALLVFEIWKKTYL